MFMRAQGDGPAVQAELPAGSGATGFAATMDVHVDARDVQRAILHVRETLHFPKPGNVTVLYPEWLPGYHSPGAPLELLSGLRFSCGEKRVEWRRDPVKVHAFHIDMPLEAKTLDIEFQMLCSTDEDQGRVGITREHLNVQWNTVLLYPAGYPSKRIQVTPSIELPENWKYACSLEQQGDTGGLVRFAPAPLDTVVDSPLFAGRHYKRYDLDPAVELNVFGDAAEDVEVGEGPLEVLKNLVVEADKLFGGRHFERYEFLVAVSDELGSLGVEHHQCTEMVMPRTFFSDWEGTRTKNDIIAHEYVHSWNGKFRRGRDSCTQTFDEPIQNSLMWVYEGLTQYWGQVLAARSGLWSPETFLGALARTAARCTNMAGRRWRPLQDTTCDPIISARKKNPWESWQRSEDYYTDGQLIWLEVDTMIRKVSEENRSLDDCARAFFGRNDGRLETLPYDFEELVGELDNVARFDWAGFLLRNLNICDPDAPLEGIAKGGYALVFQDKPSSFHRAQDKLSNLIDLTFSLGLSLSTKGKIAEVIWESPAFRAGATVGSQILMVNGREFSPDELLSAVKNAAGAGAVTLVVKKLKHMEDLEILYSGKPRYPHLVPRPGQPRRLDQIIAPRR